MDFEEVEKIINKLQEERNSLPRTDIQAHLEFMKKVEKIVHQNHYVLMMTYRWVIPITISGVWNEKDHVLRRYLKLLSLLNLGFCKDKARILFEIANKSLATAKTDFHLGKVKESDFKKIIKNELLPIFNEVKLILRFDSKTSFEGKIYSAVEFYISSLTNFVK